MDSYQITITTQDQQQLAFACRGDQTLQQGAEAENIFLPSQCGSGVCGVCTVHCQSGEFDMRDYNSEALAADAAEQGDILLCSTYPRSDLAVSTPYSYDLIHFESLAQRQAEILEIKPINDDVVALELQLLPDAEDMLSLDFEAGQFVELGIPGTDITRPYSLANAPNWDGRLAFLIQLHPQGQFSQFLRQAKVGQNISVTGAQGQFVLQESSLAPRYFVAGGTGLAPFLSMLTHMAEMMDSQTVELFIGAKHEKDLLAMEQLTALQQQLPQLKIHRCISQAEHTWQPDADEWIGAYRQSVLEVMKQTLKTAAEPVDVYVCGSPRLVNGIVEMTHTVSPESQLFYERFTTA